MNRYVISDNAGHKALVYANTESQACGLFRNRFRLSREVTLSCDRIARNVGGEARVVPITAPEFAHEYLRD